jgi:hypothetical protein
VNYVPDANEIAARYERRESGDEPARERPRQEPRYGRLIGAVMTEDLDHPTVDADGQNLWENVAVQPWADGLLMLEHEGDNLRTIVNARAYMFLEFRPNSEGE